jgi:ABC-type phosphate/phosphonate transport system substrate-binding protein
MMQRRYWAAVLTVVLVAAALAADQETVHVGLVQSLFRDVPEATIKGSIQDFKSLIEKDTRYKSDSLTVPDFGDLGKQLAEGKLQLGVFQGYEFAWVRQKYPKLRPLVIAVNQRKDVRAHLLIRAGSPIKDFAAIQGQALALPERTKAFCLLYLERRCRKAGHDLKGYFAKTTTPPNSEVALDDVVDGVVQTALVDGVSLDRYKAGKPARYAKLQELEKSVVFPPTVVAYADGGVQEATLERYRRALVNFHTTARGRQILLEWRLTHFAQVPKDYNQMLADILKVYPPPESK